ncbi:excinuclease ABC subunit UvrA [Thalassoglobus polymorphus]|uniref:UvrABC system protein A n=1 Tax=Thalassoglobus polymorphus TaxID=2527994 RepID=A0A517QV29_9PLAN|nr:excinuclease ABC subunit UvrA [Thalassoglobus polymorphus]QDT35499.1 UvrABC system protein A [Thalassoglobus polymorphus]
MSRTFEELAPQNFSFNSPLGWCPACEGLGTEIGTDQSAIVANPNLTLDQGAVSAWPNPQENPGFAAVLEAVTDQLEIPRDQPWYQLSPRFQRVILHGTDERWFSVSLPGSTQPINVQYKGLYPAIEEASRVSYPYRAKFQDLVGEKPCSVCNGDRIRDDAAAVRLNDKTLPELCKLPLEELLPFLQSLELDSSEKKIAGDLLNEASHRLSFLVDVGLHYLTLDRSMPTLSGGESQRIRLAGQIGRALTGVLYVLDEPTIGLHPRDNGRLIEALNKLKELGNTLVLVEHDREVIEAADRLYDFGPRSGRYGGNVVAEGTPKQVSRQTKASLTGAYLSGTKGIPVPIRRRMQIIDEKNEPVIELEKLQEVYADPPGESWLEILGCQQNNLRNVDLRIPLGTMTCVTGLSGSGKSSLIQDTLARGVARHLKLKGPTPGPFRKMNGAEQISRVIAVDQNPIGATPASNPATYTGVFEPIRQLYSKIPDSKIRGYKPGRFSFNRAGGRCDDCEGMGQKKIEMHFLPDVWVECDTCRGKRFNQETLAVKYKNQSIADVLEMSIGQALELFQNIPKIRVPLATLDAIGLDYLTLGQSATTLSGGEAQRVKLAAELAKPNSGRTLYLLDEPTTGLHFDDIAKLLKVLNSLVEHGNTVVIIEHNLDVIKTADWIVDLGPEAGIGGGWIVAAGTPEDVVAQSDHYLSNGATRKKTKRKKKAVAPLATDKPAFRSWTGELLKPVLEHDQRGEVDVFDAKEAARKKEGDLDISKVGKDIAAPWEQDGRRWHTVDRIARNGKPIRWEGDALLLVTDALAEIDGLQKAAWNDQASVEITARKKVGTGWFFHGLTGDEWLLRFYFRVPKGTFEEADVQARIPLKPVNELDEIQVYNRSERVRVNEKKGPFQEVVFDVHWLEEIDTPEFRQFLKEAAEAYLKQVETVEKKDPSELMPWKVLGKKWHLTRKGFPSNKRVAWKLETLEKLFDILDDTFSGLTPDHSNKTDVQYKDPSTNDVVAKLQTKRRDGIYLSLYSEPGTFALGQVSSLGKDRQITAAGSKEAIQIQLTAQSHVKAAALKKFLNEFVATVCAE